MWTTTTKQLSFNGTVSVSFGGATPPRPLQGVRLDAYRFFIAPDGSVRFEQLPASARTNQTGDFAFTDVPVLVQVQTVIPGSPPYTPVELTQPASQPNLAFRLSIEADIIKGGPSQGNQFIDIYDERGKITSDWLASHSERLGVPLSGSPTIPVLIPAEESKEAVLVAGLVSPAGPSGKTFHFLRVGRATRDEIGELGTAKRGYMNSASPSFFPGIVDAPFGSTLHIGGQFGDVLQPLHASESLYYTVSFGQYSSNPANPLVSETQILDPLFNKVYLLPTAALPNGQWQTLNLGPFNGTITDVEAPHPASLIGTTVNVYKRPPERLTTEYWPFWDLMAIWNSAAAPNELIVLALEAYEKIGGTETNPELKKLALASPAPTNAYLPLRIDNRPPFPKFLSLKTGKATFSTSTLTGLPVSLNDCGEFPVSPGDVDSNECLVVTYSIEDGAGKGNAHPHVWNYGLNVEFTRKGALSSTTVGLRNQLFSCLPIFSSSNYISGNYTPTSPPIYSVQNFKSVLVPTLLDGWPPEPNGDPPSPCQQYGAAVSLWCSVRTIDGWSRIFDYPTTRRFIIIKR